MSLRNDHGEFETGTESHYPNITPSRELRIDVEGVRIFTGEVTEWDFDYDLGGHASTVDVELLDLMAELAVLDDIDLGNREGRESACAGRRDPHRSRRHSHRAALRLT